MITTAEWGYAPGQIELMEALCVTALGGDRYITDHLGWRWVTTGGWELSPRRASREAAEADRDDALNAHARWLEARS